MNILIFCAMHFISYFYLGSLVPKHVHKIIRQLRDTGHQKVNVICCQHGVRRKFIEQSNEVLSKPDKIGLFNWFCCQSLLIHSKKQLNSPKLLQRHLFCPKDDSESAEKTYSMGSVNSSSLHLSRCTVRR